MLTEKECNDQIMAAANALIEYGQKGQMHPLALVTAAVGVCNAAAESVMALSDEDMPEETRHKLVSSMGNQMRTGAVVVMSHLPEQPPAYFGAVIDPSSTEQEVIDETQRCTDWLGREMGQSNVAPIIAFNAFMTLIVAMRHDAIPDFQLVQGLRTVADRIESAGQQAATEARH